MIEVIFLMKKSSKKKRKALTDSLDNFTTKSLIISFLFTSKFLIDKYTLKSLKQSLKIFSKWKQILLELVINASKLV